MAKRYENKSVTPEEVLKAARKTELDRRGVPRSMKARRLDQTNYYHTLWNWFGRTYNRRVQIN